MRKIISLILLIVFLISCKNEIKKENLIEEKTSEKVEKEASNIPIYNYNSLKPLLSKKDNKTYVINFWATWCAPCVKELPYFEKLNTTYKDKNVEVILVSLDFPDQVKSRLMPFLEKKKLQSKVVLLDDSDQDTWIPKISKDWSGAIPATLIYNQNRRAFFERSFHYDELEKELSNFLK